MSYRTVWAVWSSVALLLAVTSARAQDQNVSGSLNVTRNSADGSTILNINGGASATGYRLVAQNNGTNVLRVAPTGNLILDVQSSGWGPALTVNQNGSAPSGLFNGGNFGIGTSAPGELLTLQGGNLRFNLMDSPTAAQEIQAWDYNAGTAVKTAAIQFLAGQVSGYGNEGTIAFQTGSISTATERMRINSNGNVGIGTTNPVNMLTIASNSANTLLANESGALTIENLSPAANNYAGLNFADASGFPAGAIYSQITQQSSGASTNLNADLLFATKVRAQGGLPVERMRITAGGNVGIGTATPQSTLDVAGSGSDAIRVEGPTAGRFGQIFHRGDNLIISTNASGPGYGGINIINDNNVTFQGAGDLYMMKPGNLGVGTWTPVAKLDVAGNANIQGSLNVGQYATISTAAPGYMVVAANGGNLYLDAPTSNHVYERVNGNIITDVSSTGLMVNGAFSASNYTASSGTVTGSATGLTLNAGGTNQNVVIAPSGTGATVLNGNVGIGTSAPGALLEMQGATNAQLIVRDRTTVYTPSDPPPSRIVISSRQNTDTFNQPYVGSALEFQMDWGGGTLANAARIVGRGHYGWGGDLDFETAVGGSPASSYQTVMRLTKAGDVGIGTTTPDASLTVKGKIHATEVIVDTTVSTDELNVRPKAWADDVFDENYRNAPLSEVEREIKRHKHLPGVPSAQDVADNGVNLGQMQAVLLKKIEELTLHQIEQEKMITELKHENARLGQRVDQLEAGRNSL